jgi:conjugative transfer signal peptidase TraF
LFAFAAAIAAAPIPRPWTLNVSPSMPEGIYELQPVNRPVTVGDTVSICPPPVIAQVAVARGYVDAGPCAFKSESFLKLVAGTAGDVVDLGANYVAINGRCLAGAATLQHDAKRRPLPQIARGRYRLKAHQIWLWAPAARSLDSRYFGALDDRDVTVFAKPILVQGGPATLHFGGEPCPPAAR